jgi:hypothetical protein
MTLDKLILGTVEGDETVLTYLESLSPTALEDLFRPMFPTTRPERKEPKEATKPGKSPNPSGFRKTKTNALEARLANMTPAQRAFILEQGLA